MTTLHDIAVAPSAHLALRRYRVAISTMFALAGMIIGPWTASIPAIQRCLDLTGSQLSLVLLALACGGLVGMRGAGRLVDYHGSTRVMTVTSVALGAALTVTACAPNLVTLALALLALGTVHGTLNVAMNAAAVACQTVYRRPIMTSFHAQFSIAGAAVSAGCAHVYLGVGRTITIVGVALTLAVLWAIRQLAFAPDTKAVHERPASMPRSELRPTRHRLALLGLLAFCALISEGAAADWSSVYLDPLGASPARRGSVRSTRRLHDPSAAARSAAHPSWRRRPCPGRRPGSRIVGLPDRESL
jgi:MFS family permease